MGILFGCYKVHLCCAGLAYMETIGPVLVYFVFSFSFLHRVKELFPPGTGMEQRQKLLTLLVTQDTQQL